MITKEKERLKERLENLGMHSKEWIETALEYNPEGVRRGLEELFAPLPRKREIFAPDLIIDLILSNLVENRPGAYHLTSNGRSLVPVGFKRFLTYKQTKSILQEHFDKNRKNKTTQTKFLGDIVGAFSSGNGHYKNLTRWMSNHTEDIRKFSASAKVTYSSTFCLFGVYIRERGTECSLIEYKGKEIFPTEDLRKN
ncbi:hypothetical protein ACFL2G_00760 [Candidatus Omnitrophota bacterium]